MFQLLWIGGKFLCCHPPSQSTLPLSLVLRSLYIFLQLSCNLQWPSFQHQCKYHLLCAHEHCAASKPSSCKPAELGLDVREASLIILLKFNFQHFHLLSDLVHPAPSNWSLPNIPNQVQKTITRGPYVKKTKRFFSTHVFMNTITPFSNTFIHSLLAITLSSKKSPSLLYISQTTLQNTNFKILFFI